MAVSFSPLRAASWKLKQQVIRVAMADEDVDEEPSPQTSPSREWGQGCTSVRAIRDVHGAAKHAVVDLLRRSLETKFLGPGGHHEHNFHPTSISDD